MEARWGLKKTINWKFTVWVIWLKIRRELLISFRPRYVIRNIMLRTKSCDDCKKPNYCDLEYLVKVPFTCNHITEDGLCRIHFNRCYPTSCFVGPVDAYDKWTEGCVMREEIEERERPLRKVERNE